MPTTNELQSENQHLVTPCTLEETQESSQVGRGEGCAQDQHNAWVKAQAITNNQVASMKTTTTTDGNWAVKNIKESTP